PVRHPCPTRRSSDLIVAETEHTGGRLRSRLPDQDLAAFLIDLKGPDLLSSRELRFRLAVNASPDEIDRLHDYPSQCVGRGGRQRSEEHTSELQSREN